MNHHEASRRVHCCSSRLIISLLALSGVSNGWTLLRRPQSRIPQLAELPCCFTSLASTNSELVSDPYSSDHVKVESNLNGEQNNVRQQSKWTAWNRRGAIAAGCVVLGTAVASAHAAPDLTGLQPATEMQPQIPFPDLASLQQQQQQQQASLEGESRAVVLQCPCAELL
jgi:hypothetical protein